MGVVGEVVGEACGVGWAPGGDAGCAAVADGDDEVGGGGGDGGVVVVAGDGPAGGGAGDVGDGV